MLPWITINKNLEKGIDLLNQVPQSKFAPLLKHIIASGSTEYFTDEEHAKLSESLKQNPENLKLIILTIAHIYKQSSKVIVKPTVLQEQLIEVLKFDEEKAQDFVKIWTEETNKQFDLSSAKNLEKVSCELNLETANESLVRRNKDQGILKARVHLGLAVDKSEGGKEKENVTFELSEEDLQHFYNLLETVQKKLDNTQ